MPTPIIGVGQLKQQHADIPSDPARLAALAVQLALADTARPDEVSALQVVNVVSWQYDDIAAEVAHQAGLSPQEREYTDVGGHTPTRLLDEASAQALSALVLTSSHRQGNVLVNETLDDGDTLNGRFEVIHTPGTPPDRCACASGMCCCARITSWPTRFPG